MGEATRIGGVKMPRREVAIKSKILYDILDWLADNDDFDTLMCIQEWVNDNFHVVDDDMETGHLEWQ